MNKLLMIAALDPGVEVDLRHPPLGIGYLLASLQRAMPGVYDVRLVSSGVEKMLDQWRPDLVGISSTSPRFDYAQRYARAAAERGIPVLVGGIHISMLPDSLYPEMTVGVLGEGEETFVELLRLFDAEREFAVGKLAGVKGIIYHGDEGLVQTESRPCVQALEAIPMPDRSRMTIPSHTTMFTSRGCPYKCRFCASTRFWPGHVRFFSAERVVEEIELLVEKYGVKIVSFHDDLFVANLKRLEEIDRLLRRRKLIGRVEFTCNARANIVNDTLCALLKRIGVSSVNMGLESGCDKTLAWLKGNVTVAQNEHAIRTIRKHRMQAQGSFIIGSPDETEADIEQTYQFIRKMPLTFFDINLLLPYPGTAVWEVALEKGLVSNDMDWSRLTYDVRVDPHRYLNLSNHITTERLLEIHSRFMRLWYWKMVKGIIHHPYKRHLLRWGARFVSEYFRKHTHDGHAAGKTTG